MTPEAPPDLQSPLNVRFVQGKASGGFLRRIADVCVCGWGVLQSHLEYNISEYFPKEQVIWGITISHLSHEGLHCCTLRA